MSLTFFEGVGTREVKEVIWRGSGSQWEGPGGQGEGTGR